MKLGQGRPGTLRNVLKLSISEIAVENRPVFIVNVDVQILYFGEGVTVHEQQIFPAIVIEIEEAGTPADVTRISAESGFKCDVVEDSFSSIAIERFEFIGKIASKN